MGGYFLFKTVNLVLETCKQTKIDLVVDIHSLVNTLNILFYLFICSTVLQKLLLIGNKKPKDISIILELIYRI